MKVCQPLSEARNPKSPSAEIGRVRSAWLFHVAALHSAFQDYPWKSTRCKMALALLKLSVIFQISCSNWWTVAQALRLFTQVATHDLRSLSSSSSRHLCSFLLLDIKIILHRFLYGVRGWKCVLLKQQSQTARRVKVKECNGCLRRLVVSQLIN